MHAAAPCVSFIYRPMLRIGHGMFDAATCTMNIGAATFISPPCTINIAACTLNSAGPKFFVHA
ncbi:MAG: hypothetical protein JSR69_21580 [Proteobacteria bacterium]|nr:hypothetical protein [Pseudomonadota bacterium]